MGNSEEAKSCKPEKPSSPASAPAPGPALDQNSVHVYPDWTAMQAYYGHRLPVPPYFNPAAASGHAPHAYMWGPPQAMMPPYGAPYAAIYSHGGVYAHPGVPVATTPLSMDSPAKSSGNTDRGLMKKLKGFDGLAMSIGSGHADSNDGGTDANSADHGLSQSGDTEGSSDGSDGNTTGAGQNDRKRSREGSPNVVGDGKTDAQRGAVLSGKPNGDSEKVMGFTAGVPGKMVGPGLSPSMATALELKNPPSAGSKASPASVQQPSTVVQNEPWSQNERELKRERRKQSNRESARRSRLRKQAEAEELAIKVEALTADNMTLKSEINRVTEKSEKLKLKNAKLVVRMKTAQLGQTEDTGLSKVDDGLSLTANLLARVNNAGSVSNEGEGEKYEKNSGAKLRQLLNASPRADAVAAG